MNYVCNLRNSLCQRQCAIRCRNCRLERNARAGTTYRKVDPSICLQPVRLVGKTQMDPLRGPRWVQTNIMGHRGIQPCRLDFLVVPPVAQHVL
jgi:hypothetical protein